MNSMNMPDFMQKYYEEFENLEFIKSVKRK